MMILKVVTISVLDFGGEKIDNLKKKSPNTAIFYYIIIKSIRLQLRKSNSRHQKSSLK